MANEQQRPQAQGQQKQNPQPAAATSGQVNPPAASQITRAASWVEVAEAELEAAGWERFSTDGRGGTVWSDPAGAGPKGTDPKGIEFNLAPEGQQEQIVRQAVV